MTNFDDMTVPEFRVLIFSQLDTQYEQLAAARADGNIEAHQVSLEIIKTQMQLAGEVD